jgi:hypothetical protein
MVEDQQVRTALETLVTLKGSVGAVEVGKCRPAGAGCSAEWNRDTGNIKPVGKKLPAIENLASPGRNYSITGLSDEILLQSLKIRFAAVMLEIFFENPQATLIELS